MTLEELKLFLRVDDTEEDTLIQALQIASEEYLANAGILKDYTKELYKLAIKILVGHWYENRHIDNSYSKDVSKIAYTLDVILVQLKYTMGDGLNYDNR